MLLAALEYQPFSLVQFGLKLMFVHSVIVSFTVQSLNIFCLLFFSPPSNMAFTLLENFSFGFSLIFVQTHRRISPNLKDLTSITFGTPDPVFFPLLLLCQSFPLTWLQFPHFTKPFLCNLCSVLDTLARCLNDPDAVLQVTTTFPFLQSDYRL